VLAGRRASGILSASRVALADPELAQDILREAPSRQRRLEQVRAHEGREPQPVDAVHLTQRQAEQDKRSRDETNPAFERHPKPSGIPTITLHPLVGRGRLVLGARRAPGGHPSGGKAGLSHDELQDEPDADDQHYPAKGFHDASPL